MIFSQNVSVYTQVAEYISSFSFAFPPMFFPCKAIDACQQSPGLRPASFGLQATASSKQHYKTHDMTGWRKREKDGEE